MCIRDRYNSHDKETGGRAIMTKGRKTTFEERVEIVQYCIDVYKRQSQFGLHFTPLIVTISDAAAASFCPVFIF